MNINELNQSQLIIFYLREIKFNQIQSLNSINSNNNLQINCMNYNIYY